MKKGIGTIAKKVEKSTANVCRCCQQQQPQNSIKTLFLVYFLTAAVLFFVVFFVCRYCPKGIKTKKSALFCFYSKIVRNHQFRIENLI